MGPGPGHVTKTARVIGVGCVQVVRVSGQRGGDGDAAAQWAQGEGDEADGHSAGGSQLRSSAGPAPGGHEPHAGTQEHAHKYEYEYGNSVNLKSSLVTISAITAAAAVF